MTSDPETDLFQHLSERYPELHQTLRARLRNTSLLSTFEFIAIYFNLSKPKPTDPIAGTATRMLAQIKKIEDDGK